MKKMTINGKEVMTNYGAHGYPFSDGNDKATMRMYLQKFGETDREMLERLAALGYKRITFYNVTTRIRGCYHVIAFAK